MLRIACANAYPGLIDECEQSIRLVRPGPVCRVPSQGCVYVTCYWTHWPCLFPQHGPGRKHDRPIVLADWQRELVEQYPGRFRRGLFHSDGCRITNWTTKRVGTGVDCRVKRYEYPRYFFTNHSTDILDLCESALDLLGVAYRRPKPIHISVARREAVALLDQHVGPKS